MRTHGRGAVNRDTHGRVQQSEGQRTQMRNRRHPLSCRSEARASRACTALSSRSGRPARLSRWSVALQRTTTGRSTAPETPVQKSRERLRSLKGGVEARRAERNQTHVTRSVPQLP